MIHCLIDASMHFYFFQPSCCLFIFGGNPGCKLRGTVQAAASGERFQLVA